ncbi:MAG: hypothetical protein RI973_1414 [Bacteroidota bacterium]|jgi:hypothetical protein
MIARLRHSFNKNFSREKYEAFLHEIFLATNHRPPFPIAETPVFVPKKLADQLFQACHEFTELFCRPDFKEMSNETILQETFVPGESDHPTFLCIDFGITLDENGQPTPRLIEIQGFPSLYFYQDLCARSYRKHYEIPAELLHLFNGLDSESYRDKLRHIIVGDSRPENVVLLEVEPWKQNTQVDFLATQNALGIAVKCVSELKVSGREVWYQDQDGRKVQVERIYNRVIFDELLKRNDLPREFSFSAEYDLHWVGHPHWFSRISKHTLPLLDSPYAPESRYLDAFSELPARLDDYVLKPLYSFSGQGVIIHPTPADIEAIPEGERHHFILQKKVDYAPLVETPDEPAKAEIRMMLVWEDGAARPEVITNLVRLSKGEMVGVRYNKGKSWVGGSVGFFET